VRTQRYLVHYPSRRQDVGLLAAVVLPLLAILAGMVAFGGVVWWVLGLLDLALLGPVVAFLAWDVRNSMRQGRHRTIQVSIDLEGVYDGATGTFLPWSRVTAVKFVSGEAPSTMVVVGREPDLVTFSVRRSAAESAVRAFAPQVPVEYVSRPAAQRLLDSGKRR
jgi:hypothetical protein